MNKFYLYIKESPLGLKYLGKCSKDPYKYMGSGKVWKKHIKENSLTSKDIKTKIILETENTKELVEAGRYYSKLYNVVKDPNWANLIVEEGDGGVTTKGKIWVNDGNIDMFLYPTEVPEGFTKGRLSVKGINNPMSNKLISRRQHSTCEVEVQQIDPKNNKVVATYKSMTEAAISIGTDQGRISKCCKYGFISKGFKFKIK